MITIYEDYKDTNKLDLFAEVDKVLAKRMDLWERYSRGISFDSLGPDGDGKLEILFEKFIVDLASGYLSGDITYDVDVSNEVEKKIGTALFGKQPVDKDYSEELKYIIYTLTSMNHDDAEEAKLFRQMVLFGSTYERILEDKNNILRYHNLDALNTVAIWDNKLEPEVVAVVSKFSVKKNTVTTDYFRVYLKDKIVIYRRDNLEKVVLSLLDDETKEHEWNKVPVNVYESEFSILDRCAGLIKAYQNLLNNVKNTYQYNDTDCKMKIVNYRPKNPITIPDPKKPGHQMINPDRIEEDNYVLASKTFYVEDGGDADWIIKPVSAGDVTTMLKYYVDSIFQMCGIPNTADLAFNSGDLNASAIDRKFYVMNIMMAEIRDGVEQLLRDRFNVLLARVNLKLGKRYSMENVNITIGTNLPSMQDENIDQLLKLNGIISEKTVMTKLGFDFETEQQNKEEEENEAMGQVRRITGKTNEEDEQEETGDSTSDTTEGEEDSTKNK